jgi:hypothetical protein
MSDRRGTPPGYPPEGWGLLVRWPAKALVEIALAPWTIQRVRRSLTELPDRIDSLTEALRQTTDQLGSTLPSVDEGLVRMNESVSRLETTVNEVGEVVFGIVGSIPGVRRAVRSVRAE